MTSNQVHALRKNLGFTATQFATLLGVSTSTVSRWEGSPDGAEKIDPGTLSLLTVLAGCFERKPSAGRKVFAEEIDKAFAIGGRIKALHVILNDHFSDSAI